MRKHSKVSKLNEQAAQVMRSSKPVNVLDVALILSALISGVFFWQNAGGVFDITPFPIVNNLLAVIFGVTASEGAFFGWRQYRTNKTNMTQKQLDISEWGAWAAIVSAGITTVAAVMLNSLFMPPSLLQYRDGFVLVAIAAPLVIQACLAMSFSLYSQETTENFERSKNDALVFDQAMLLERARIMGLVDATAKFFDERLEDYQREIAPLLAQTLFDYGADAVLNFGMGRKTANEQKTLPVYSLQRYANGRWETVATGGTVRELSAMFENMTGAYRVIDSSGRAVVSHSPVHQNGTEPDFLEI